MAANFESGFFVARPAWHGLGKVLTAEQARDMDSSEFIVAAGLNWTVSKKPAYFHDGNGRAHRIPDTFAVVRDSDNSSLGVVGDKWQPLQNVDAFRWFDPFIESGKCRFETAGSLRGGQIVWILAQILQDGQADILPGDTAVQRVLLSQGHNDKLAIRLGFTTTRVVCENTIRAAHSSAASKLIRIRHSSRTEKHMEAVRDIMDLSRQEFIATQEQMRRLASRNICAADVTRYVRLTLATIAGKTKAEIAEIVEGKNLSTRMKNMVADCLAVIEQAPGSQFARGTLYNAAQGMNFYVNHNYGNKPEARLDKIFYSDLGNLPFAIADEFAQTL